MELEKIISESLKNNPKAERELYYLYAKRIFGICRRYTTDRHQAEDYMQESFEKIFLNLSKYDKTKSAFSTWVSTIVVYHIISHKKKRKIQLNFDEIHLEADKLKSEDSRIELKNELCYGITAEELLSAIRQLPDDSRNIINLYVFENWKHADIAALLGIEVSSSRSKLTRAKKQLKNILTKKLKSSYEGKLA